MNLLLIFMCSVFHTFVESAIFHRPLEEKKQAAQFKKVKGAILGIRPTYYRLYRSNREFQQKFKKETESVQDYLDRTLPLIGPTLKKGATGEFLEDYEIPLLEDNETPKENTSTNGIEGASISAIKDNELVSDFNNETKTSVESSAQTHASYEEEEKFSDSESEPEKDNHWSNRAQTVENELENVENSFQTQTWGQYFKSKMPSRPSLPGMRTLSSLPSMPRVSLPRPSWPKFLSRKNSSVLEENSISTEQSNEKEPSEELTKKSWWPWSKKN